MPRLSRYARCFQGVIPSGIATCARDGTPNVTYISQVYFVDDRHVALSCQFFNKTRKNLEENPHAQIELWDPLTFECFRLRVRFLRAETSGPLFESMALRIETIASQFGLTGVFKLLSADVCEVIQFEEVEDFMASGPPEVATIEPEDGPLTEIRALQCLSARISRATSLDELLTATLDAFQEVFGFGHSMVLVPEGERRLVTIASRGYGESGVGAEVVFGEGLIGIVAAEQRLLRVGGARDTSYGRAVRDRVVATGGGGALHPEIPLPGLHDAAAQLALPLVAQGRLLGVIALESRNPLAFDEWHEAFLQIIATQVAMAIDRLVDEELEEEALEDATGELPAVAPAPLKLTFYKRDDCVFIGDEYLVRNIPGKILWKLLRAFVGEGRTAFTNRELRLDPWLGLPEIRDNLESRLILLRRRLEEKCPEIRMVPAGRGRFALEVTRTLALAERD
ncbi:MAG: GAF domain-containing protein [Deltaproteobacteria bacterium]|nr:GAF domain-containing protein [Kofleriaceae bacterium]